jgi:hypothetical protein
LVVLHAVSVIQIERAIAASQGQLELQLAMRREQERAHGVANLQPAHCIISEVLADSFDLPGPVLGGDGSIGIHSYSVLYVTVSGALPLHKAWQV